MDLKQCDWFVTTALGTRASVLEYAIHKATQASANQHLQKVCQRMKHGFAWEQLLMGSLSPYQFLGNAFRHLQLMDFEGNQCVTTEELGGTFVRDNGEKVHYYTYKQHPMACVGDVTFEERFGRHTETTWFGLNCSTARLVEASSVADDAILSVHDALRSAFASRLHMICDMLNHMYISTMDKVSRDSIIEVSEGYTCPDHDQGNSTVVCLEIKNSPEAVYLPRLWARYYAAHPAILVMASLTTIIIIVPFVLS